MTTSTAPHASTAPHGGDWRRTHTCGDLRASDVGSTVTLNGWVAARRDHGGIYFVDLRDRAGLAQVVLPGDEERIGFEGGAALAPEYCLSVTGRVVMRESPNPSMPTGLVEVIAERVELLSSSKLPPFEADGEREPGDKKSRTRVKP